MTKDYDGHDQCGSLFGQVIIDFGVGRAKEVFELNLPGLKQRRWENTLVEHELGRTVCLFGACKDGSVYAIGAKTFKESHTK